MAESIEDKTLRELVEDRDGWLKTLREEVVQLAKDKRDLRQRLDDLGPLSFSDVVIKKRMADFDMTHEMLRKDQDAPETASVHVMALQVMRERDDAVKLAGDRERTIEAFVEASEDLIACARDAR